MKKNQNENAVAAFAPATVSNVGCGFDVLGFALDAPGDTVIARRQAGAGVSLDEVSGEGGRLPRDPARNTASVAASALVDACGAREGVALIVRKGLPLASGLGSSGASAVAAVVAVNELLGLRAPLAVLLQSAMEGERAACGARHPDNVAPALMGGFVLARQIDPPDVIRLPVPRDLACAVLHPAIEVSTAASRAVLPVEVPLADAVRQWANVGALVAALYTSDLDLLGRAMHDYIVEPRRAHLVPGFARVKQAAMDAGAIGSSLSGSGPSIFALCRSLDVAQVVGDAMRRALLAGGELEGDVFVSRVAPVGARVIEDASSRP